MMRQSAFSPPGAEQILGWYDRHHRELPWRVSPSERLAGIEPDPYRVWLSEIMLQQTTVTAVRPYFHFFTEKWPTVADLAAADTEDVMKAWAGLGYYARARNLKKCAEAVAANHRGRFPQTEQGLKALPGIGDYTAAAIASIAFDLRAVVMDGNIERVVSRLFAIAEPLPGAKPAIKRFVDLLTPDERAGDFAQAMMDLGATICTPKRPACVLCPFNENCQALRDGDPERFPVKAARKQKPVRLGAAFVALSDQDTVYLQKRPATGLLGGMTEVPTTAWTARLDGATDCTAAPFAAQWKSMGVVTHVFTHFELRLTIYLGRTKQIETGKGWWEPLDSLDGQALPSVMKKAVAAAIGRIDESDQPQAVLTARKTGKP